MNKLIITPLKSRRIERALIERVSYDYERGTYARSEMKLRVLSYLK